MQRKATPQPFGTYTQPLRLTRTGDPSYQRVIILCEDGRRCMQFVRARLEAGDRAFQSFGSGDWQLLDLDTGHGPMLSAPEELTELLHRLGV